MQWRKKLKVRIRCKSSFKVRIKGLQRGGKKAPWLSVCKKSKDDIAKGSAGRFRLRHAVDTHRFSSVETVDEAGFYGHAAQCQAHQQEQQGLSHSSPPSPLTQPGRHRRPVGKAVHHIHRGISTLGHSYSVHSVTEQGFSVEIPYRSCWRVLNFNKAARDKQALESQRRVEGVAKWVGLLVVGSSGEGSRVVR